MRARCCAVVAVVGLMAPPDAAAERVLLHAAGSLRGALSEVIADVCGGIRRYGTAEVRCLRSAEGRDRRHGRNFERARWRRKCRSSPTPSSGANSPPGSARRKVTYFEPVPPRLARNTIIESTFDVGRRFRCTMRIDCGQLDRGAVIRPTPGEWEPRMPERLDEEDLADWRAGRNAVYQLAALAIGTRLAVAEG
jgi:hypothetical protein